MSDPTQMPGQPTEEEMRAYLEQLRQADPAGLIAEAFNLLATGAQVKLGRPDARVLIDALAAVVQAAQATLPDDLVAQMTQGVTQLQLAQVQAEREAAGAQQQPAADLTQPNATEGPGTAPGPAGSPGPDKRMTDRLWVPGRDPNPR